MPTAAEERLEGFRQATMTFLEQDTMYRIHKDQGADGVATLARYVLLIQTAETPREIINYLVEVAEFAPESLS